MEIVKTNCAFYLAEKSGFCTENKAQPLPLKFNLNRAAYRICRVMEEIVIHYFFSLFCTAIS